ncbi:MAG: hypothetical protein ACREKM_03595 [Longimicrobiales bacterium]
MAIPFAPLLPGTRVRIRHGDVPLDPALVGRTGIVTVADDYHAARLGVVLDGEAEVRMFRPGELEVTRAVPLPPERVAARLLRALP